MQPLKRFLADESTDLPPVRKNKFFPKSAWIAKLTEFPRLSKGDVLLAQDKPKMVYEALKNVEAFQPGKVETIQLQGFIKSTTKPKATEKYLITTSASSIHIWDLATGKSPATIIGFNALTRLKIERNFLYAVNGTLVKKWDLETMREKAIFGPHYKDGGRQKENGHSANITDLSIGEEKLFTASTDRMAKVWQDKEENPICVNTFNSTAGITQVKVREDTLVSAQEDGDVTLHNILSMREIFKITTPSFEPARIKIAEGRLFILYCYRGTIEIIDLDNSKEGLALISPNSRVGIYATASCLTATVKRVFVGYLDGSVRVWDAESCKLLHTLSGHTKNVKQIKIVGHRLLTTSEDKTVKVWDVENGKLVKSIDHAEHMCWNRGRLIVIGQSSAQIFDFRAGII